MRLSWKEKSVDMPASVDRVNYVPKEPSIGVGLTLEEEGGLVGNQVTSKVLRRVDQAGDDGSPKVSALEKIKDGGVSTLDRLDLDSTLHHGKGVVSLGLGLRAETFDGA